MPGPGYDSITISRANCTNSDFDEVFYAFSSFPSGHATYAFAGFIYLHLYLNAKLKVWSNYCPMSWKLVAAYAPVLAAIIMAGLVVVDTNHHWYDALAGAVLGTTIAFASFRTMYASIWDYRFNHIPLLRGVPFKYSLDPESTIYDELSNTTFTRQAGWGSGIPEMRSGAPFDSVSPGAVDVDGREPEHPSSVASEKHAGPMVFPLITSPVG